MVYYNALYKWVVFHPLYNPTNQGCFFIAQLVYFTYLRDLQT